MEYIVWKDSFKIGVKAMDDQHMQFVSHINELYNAMQSGNAEAIVEPTLEKLTEYIRSHFTAEEAILESINYPNFEGQIKQHEYFISELTFLKSSILDKTQTAQNTLLFLKDWFLHHITTEDLKYVEYI